MYSTDSQGEICGNKSKYEPVFIYFSYLFAVLLLCIWCSCFFKKIIYLFFTFILICLYGKISDAITLLLPLALSRQLASSMLHIVHKMIYLMKACEAWCRMSIAGVWK